jgi:predicted nucleic acid-binding protein
VKFWDSSAIVATIVSEGRCGVVRQLLREDDQVAAWWGTRVECAAALFRRWREGRFDVQTLENSLRGLALSARGWREVPASDLVRNKAFRCLRLHRLRTGDALQLAAALEWVDSAPGGSSFVTLDDQLGDAARAEGFTVLPA